jgi:hypothetical protein
MLKDYLVKNIQRIRINNTGDYISNHLKDFFLLSGVIHHLILPFLPESNGIMEHLNQIMNTSARSLTIRASHFPCLWADAINMVAYLKNRLLYKNTPLINNTL